MLKGINKTHYASPTPQTIFHPSEVDIEAYSPEGSTVYDQLWT